MVAGIQNCQFKVERQTWVFHNGNTSPQKLQPGLNRHVVAVVDCYFVFHYDVRDIMIHKYPMQYLEGDRQDELKYTLRVEKVYCVKLIFQYFKRTG